MCAIHEDDFFLKTTIKKDKDKEHTFKYVFFLSAADLFSQPITDQQPYHDGSEVVIREHLSKTTQQAFS